MTEREETENAGRRIEARVLKGQNHYDDGSHSIVKIRLLFKTKDETKGNFRMKYFYSLQNVLKNLFRNLEFRF